MPLNITTLTKSVQSNITLLPQSTTASIFIVSGDVAVIALTGVCTVIIGAVANATKLQAVCGALTAVDLCATADVNALAAGTIFAAITSFATGATIAATNGVLVNGPSATAQATGFIMSCGRIGVKEHHGATEFDNFHGIPLWLGCSGPRHGGGHKSAGSAADYH